MQHLIQTIAIIGNESDFTSYLVESVKDKNIKILVLDKNEMKVLSAKKMVDKYRSSVDIEVLNCEHEACWEADLVMITEKETELNQIADRIRDVSTQKNVILKAKEMTEELMAKMEHIFPYSKISILIQKTQDKRDLLIYSKHKSALNAINHLFNLNKEEEDNLLLMPQ